MPHESNLLLLSGGQGWESGDGLPWTVREHLVDDQAFWYHCQCKFQVSWHWQAVHCFTMYSRHSFVLFIISFVMFFNSVVRIGLYF